MYTAILAEATQSELITSRNFIFLIIAVLLFCAGLASIIRRKPIGLGKSFSKYSEASLKKYSVPYGLALAIVGASFVAREYMPDPLFNMGGTVITAGAAINFAGLFIAIIITTAAMRLLKLKR